MALAAGLAAMLVWQMADRAKLREENEVLSEQIAQGNQRATNGEQNAPTETNNTPALSADEQRELLRLRGEVALMKQKVAEAERAAQAAKASAARIVPAPAAPEVEDPAMAQQRQMSIAKLNFSKNWLLAFILYAQEHGGQIPTAFEQASSFLPDSFKGETNLTTDQFEIVYQGSLTNLPPRQLIVMCEKQAWPALGGGWSRAYGFADGHSEVHHSDDGNFAPWEQQFMAQPGNP